jgi:hypothetical protein
MSRQRLLLLDRVATLKDRARRDNRHPPEGHRRNREKGHFFDERPDCIPDLAIDAARSAIVAASCYRVLPD